MLITSKPQLFLKLSVPCSSEIPVTGASASYIFSLAPRVADPHSFNAAMYPFHADPDPATNLDEDPNLDQCT